MWCLLLAWRWTLLGYEAWQGVWGWVHPEACVSRALQNTAERWKELCAAGLLPLFALAVSVFGCLAEAQFELVGLEGRGWQGPGWYPLAIRCFVQQLIQQLGQ